LISTADCTTVRPVPGADSLAPPARRAVKEGRLTEEEAKAKWREIMGGRR
jgi:hypothetical protein